MATVDCGNWIVICFFFFQSLILAPARLHNNSWIVYRKRGELLLHCLLEKERKKKKELVNLLSKVSQL